MLMGPILKSGLAILTLGNMVVPRLRLARVEIPQEIALSNDPLM